DPTARAVGALRDQHPLPDLVRRHGDSRDDEERAVLTRAVRAQRDAIACDARLHPTPELLARIGARPDHPSDQRSWDAAVGADAVLRELSDRAVPEPNEFGLPTPARVASLLRNAEIVHLARQPTRDVADEAGALTAELTAGGRASPLRRRQLAAALERADQTIERAQRLEAALPAQRERAAGPGPATNARGAHHPAE